MKSNNISKKPHKSVRLVCTVWIKDEDIDSFHTTYGPDFIAKKLQKKNHFLQFLFFIEILLRRSTCMKNSTHNQPINFQN